MTLLNVNVFVDQVLKASHEDATALNVSHYEAMPLTSVERGYEYELVRRDQDVKDSVDNMVRLGMAYRYEKVEEHTDETFAGIRENIRKNLERILEQDIRAVQGYPKRIQFTATEDERGDVWLTQEMWVGREWIADGIAVM